MNHPALRQVKQAIDLHGVTVQVVFGSQKGGSSMASAKLAREAVKKARTNKAGDVDRLIVMTRVEREGEVA